jgi:phosphate starvation-inducible protein PhoH and related proteins
MAYKKRIAKTEEDFILRLKDSNKAVKPLNEKQAQYIDSISDKDIICAEGSAGSGRTFIAIATAYSMFRMGLIKRIVITRATIEACGENLGFLPGSASEKIMPYLNPIFDNLEKLIDKKEIEKLINENKLIIQPIAFIRGRTFDDAVIIVTESQNLSFSQFKAILTRIGYGTKCIFEGDLDQIDLKKQNESGFSRIIDIFKDEDYFSVIKFTEEDCVRSEICKKIVKKFKENT